MLQVKVGIDAGGSLIKVAYQEKEKVHYKKYSINQLDQAISWLKITAPSFKVALTGGKSKILQGNYFPEGVIIPEFQATCDGARLFLKEEKKKVNESFLLVNIGTGTSWHIVKGDKYERILGSGVGGGTFTGLGSLLTDVVDFNHLTVLAEKGVKENVDLLVKDIYELAETPINGELTAANFAKGKLANPTKADQIASLSNMMAETIVLLTMQAAALHQVKDIIFIGSTLSGNPALKKGLESFMEMVGLNSEFLLNGEYCGAAGALYSV
jgi:type II pantothenate kinase